MLNFLTDLLYYAAVGSEILVIMCAGAIAVFCVIGFVGLWMNRDGGRHA